MAGVISRGNLFPAELVPELINAVKGKSALAALCAKVPVPFNGQTEFIFTLDKEIDVVAENGAKTKGGATLTPQTIVPVKVEYSARVSDEFLYGSESEQIDVLKAFSEGFARKVARGFDLMAFHGVNPRTGTASAVIGNNHYDKLVTQTVTISTGDKPDSNIESAIALVQGSEYDPSGLVLAPVFRSALAAQVDGDGRKIYPELAWGNEPGAINGLKTVSNMTLSANSSLDRALVGDFAENFRWGYSKEIPLEIIRYGNPDNDTDLGDLKGRNQVLLRSEMYLGWGVLDPNAFAFVKATASI